MKKGEFQKFWDRREQRTRLVLDRGSLNTKRFYALDSAVYEDGALAGRVKELLGLVASLVARCDECVNYHLKRCQDAGFSTGEIVEALDVGLLIGGSIVIPHHRRALETWLELEEETPADRPGTGT